MPSARKRGDVVRTVGHSQARPISSSAAAERILHALAVAAPCAARSASTPRSARTADRSGGPPRARRASCRAGGTAVSASRPTRSARARDACAGLRKRLRIGLDVVAQFEAARRREARQDVLDHQRAARTTRASRRSSPRHRDVAGERARRTRASSARRSADAASRGRNPATSFVSVTPIAASPGCAPRMQSSITHCAKASRCTGQRSVTPSAPRRVPSARRRSRA